MPEDKKMITVDESEYKGLLAKTVSQGTQIDQLKAQLHDATEAVNVLQAKIDSAENQEKEALIDVLFRDSQGKLSKEMLAKDSLKELYIRKETIDKAEPKTFVSVMRQREEDAKKPVSPGTVGTFNQATGKYEGGLDI